ncbi:MAG: hypothetical protein AAGD13_05825 [Pseudomonadota bacterium]
MPAQSSKSYIFEKDSYDESVTDSTDARINFQIFRPLLHDFYTSTRSSLEPRTSEPDGELRIRVLDATKWAKTFCEYESEEELNQAASEAFQLIDAGLFSAAMFPKISVDSYGEFCFILKRESAYVDIGVEGTGRVSYHIRNDTLNKSTHGDDEIANPLTIGEIKLALDEIN